MSALLLSSAIFRRSTSVSGAVLPHQIGSPVLLRLALSPSGRIAGPLPFLAAFRQQYSHYGCSPIGSWALGRFHPERRHVVVHGRNAVARLYARYILTGAALSAYGVGRSRAYCEAFAGGGEDVIHIDTLAGEEEVMDVKTLLGNTKLSRFWAAGKRIVALSLLAAPMTLLYPLAALSNAQSINEFTWEYALYATEKAGPTFIKLCQWASTRADLFPIEFCSRFARLQDSTRGHAWKDTDKLLRETLGEDWRDTIDLVGEDPIGSGCIGQVYKGRLAKDVGLHPKGMVVAVKIQHPNVKKKVTIDFYLLNKIAALFESIPRLNLSYLSLRDSVEQFGSIMFPQLDLSCEARNLQQFRHDFRDDELICFPQPLMELSSSDLLIEEFVHGNPILSYMKDGNTLQDRRDLAELGLRAVLNMIFLHDFVHGDLHPGNLLVNKTDRGKLRLNLIDAGLVVKMGPADHKNLIGVMGSFVKRDGRNAAKLMIDNSKHCEATDLDVELFCNGIAQICKDDEQNNFMEKIGDYVTDICYMACKHKVKLEAKFINVALACEIVEGIASSLNPDLTVQEMALPLVLKAEVLHGLRQAKLPW